jgi:phosphatidylglycerophosphate synthase
LGHLTVSKSVPTIDRRPDESRLRASAVAVHTVCLTLVVSLAWAARESFELSSGYPLRAAGAFGLLALATLGGLRAHPFSWFGIANTVTTVRAALVGLVIAATVEPRVGNVALGAALTALAAAALDGVDGWAARRSGMASEFGARYDMEVDAILVLALSVLAWRTGKAEAWIVSAGVMRYAFVAGGWVWGWLKRPLPPRWRRQAVCVVQVVAMSAALLPGLAPETALTLLGGALALLVYSFGVDIAWLWKRRAAFGGVAIA